MCREEEEAGDSPLLKGQSQDMNKVRTLRNYHVKKLLNHLGGQDVAPYLQKAIKRSFSEFAEDITREDRNDEGQEDSYGNY